MPPNENLVIPDCNYMPQLVDIGSGYVCCIYELPNLLDGGYFLDGEYFRGGEVKLLPEESVELEQITFDHTGIVKTVCVQTLGCDNEHPNPPNPTSDCCDEFELDITNEFIEEGEPHQGCCLVTMEIITPPCACLLYTSPSPRDLSTSRMPSSA